MWINEIVTRKYNLNGYNNPTDYIVGLFGRLEPRKKGMRRAYLVGAPEHGNMGDQAIVLAMKKYAERLDENLEVLVFAISSVYDTLPAIQKDCRKGDMIFLVGGGNMGVAYFGNEEVRRLFIQAFPHNRIVIFPQTIDYGKDGEAELEKAVSIYSKHKDLHIFARESVSYEIMKKFFQKNHVYLVPDIVFSLNYPSKWERSGILCCIRNDRESRFSAEQVNDFFARLQKLDTIKKTTTVMQYVPMITSESIREKLVFRKMDEFAQSALVVTDRLHGLIFSVVTNTPCIVLPNFDHKLTSSYQTWLLSHPNILLWDETQQIENLYERILMETDENDLLARLRNNYSALNAVLIGD